MNQGTVGVSFLESSLKGRGGLRGISATIIPLVHATTFEAQATTHTLFFPSSTPNTYQASFSQYTYSLRKRK